MEFTELATSFFKQNAVQSFNLTSSEYYLGLLGSTTEVILLKMEHYLSQIHTFPYKVQCAKLPTKCPSFDLIQRLNLATVYSSSSILKRQYLSLDPSFVSDLCEESVKVHPIMLTWAPKKLFNEDVLAIVASNGACELRSKNNVCRDWNHPVCDLAQFYQQVFPKPQFVNANTFEVFIETVENYCTTSFSWNLNLEYKTFASANSTGWLFLFVVKNGHINFVSSFKTNLERITYIYFEQNILIACSVKGIIKTYSINNSQIQEADTLWARADKMPCRQIRMSFLKNINQWYVVTSKSSYALVFLLSQEAVVQDQTTKYLGNVEITGMILLVYISIHI